MTSIKRSGTPRAVRWIRALSFASLVFLSLAPAPSRADGLTGVSAVSGIKVFSHGSLCYMGGLMIRPLVQNGLWVSVQGELRAQLSCVIGGTAVSSPAMATFLNAAFTYDGQSWGTCGNWSYLGQSNVGVLMPSAVVPSCPRGSWVKGQMMAMAYDGLNWTSRTIETSAVYYQ